MVVYAVLGYIYQHHVGSEPVLTYNTLMITVILNLCMYVITGLLSNSMILVSVQLGFFF